MSRARGRERLALLKAPVSLVNITVDLADLISLINRQTGNHSPLARKLAVLELTGLPRVAGRDGTIHHHLADYGVSLEHSVSRRPWYGISLFGEN